MNSILRICMFSFIIVLSLFSCKSDNKVEEPAVKLPTAVVPAISADSAYYFIEKQLSFGVRVPGTVGHIATRDWIVGKMKSYGATTELQEFKASFLGKVDVPSYNIICKVNPENKNRVVLFAHWDTRMIAEKDSDVAKQKNPIPGAIDGASGVAGLLEIARTIQKNKLDLGVDFVFFDAEDQGDNSVNWCIGSQFWSASIANNKEKPKFGILLDLIGAKNATYGKEGYSMQFAPEIVNKVWELAAKMNKSQIFQVYDVGGIIDDHFYVNAKGKIPTIDIIETTPNGTFGHYHHTHKDDLSEVDRSNLGSVIQVVTAVLYKVSDGSF